MLKVEKTLRQIVLFPLSVFLFLTGFFLCDFPLMNIGILLLWVNNLLFALERLETRMFYLAFMVTFFTFLMGRTIAVLLFSFEEAHQFSDEILRHTNLCLFIALLTFYLVYVLFETIRPVIRSGAIRDLPDDTGRYSSPTYTSVRFVSKVVFFATYLFDIMIAVEKAFFVFRSGYAEYYVSFSSNLPYLFVKLADVCTVAFFIFLATMPSKREVRLPVLLYLLSALAGLFGGKRSELVVPLLIVILYYFVRNRINPGGSPWLTRRHVAVLAVAAPFLLASMYLFNAVRFGSAGASGSFAEMVAGFFNNLGFSVNVISYEKLYEADIPNKLYAIGDTVDYLRENALTQLFIRSPVYRAQTIEKALEGNNFTHLITYLYSEKFYLAGRGLGSSYIAEAYHDLGYFGVALWSGIYCALFKFVYSFKNRGIILTTMSFVILKSVLLAPRAVASGFLSELININTWLVILLVFLAARFIRQKTGMTAISYENKVLQ